MHKIIFLEGDQRKEFYVESSTYAGAIAMFREEYPDRSRYKIVEVCKVILGDWSKY